MTSRERVLAALARRATDRTPFSLGFGINEPVKKELMQNLGFETMQQLDAYLLSHSDLRWVSPKYIGPASRCFRDADGIYTNEWGVKRAPVYYRPDAFYSEICHYPLAAIESAEELDSHIWPSADWYDFSSLPAQIAEANADGRYAMVMGNGNIFESSWYMRGLEQMMIDLAAQPELANAIMTRVTDYFIDYFTAALEVTNKNGAAPIDIILTADDIGGQEGLLFSLPMWETLIKPHHKRLNKVLHSYNVKIMYHSDGAIMEALEGLIDMGIDILEALQFDAKGMDPQTMAKVCGNRLCFHGGISVQSTLPYGTPAAVREEVESRIRILGQNGGYILAPSHAIQAGTPVENVKALLSYRNAEYKASP